MTGKRIEPTKKQCEKIYKYHDNYYSDMYTGHENHVNAMIDLDVEIKEITLNCGKTPSAEDTIKLTELMAKSSITRLNFQTRTQTAYYLHEMGVFE